MACRESNATPAQSASAVLLPVDKSAQVETDAQKAHPDVVVEEVDIIVPCNGISGNGQMVCEAMEKGMDLNITFAQNANAPLQVSTSMEDFPTDDSEETDFVRQTTLDTAPESTKQKFSGSGCVPSFGVSTSMEDFPTDDSAETDFVRQTTLDTAPESTKQKFSGSGCVPSVGVSTSMEDFPTDDSAETDFVRQTTLDTAPESTKQKFSGSGYVPSLRVSTSMEDFPTDDSEETDFVRQTTLDTAPESTKLKFLGSPSSEASTTADDLPSDDSEETDFVRQTTLDTAPESTKQKYFGSISLQYSEAKFDDGLRLQGPNQTARGLTFKMEVMEEQALPDDDIVEPARKPYGWMFCSGPVTRK